MILLLAANVMVGTFSRELGEFLANFAHPDLLSPLRLPLIVAAFVVRTNAVFARAVGFSCLLSGWIDRA